MEGIDMQKYEVLKITEGISVFKRFNSDLTRPIYYMDQQGKQTIQCKQSMFILPIFQISLRMDKVQNVQQILQRQYLKIQCSLLSNIQKIQGYTLLKVIQQEETINYQNYQKMKYVRLNFIYYPKEQIISLISTQNIQEIISDGK